MPDIFHWKCEKFNKEVVSSFVLNNNLSTGFLPFRLDSNVNKTMFNKSAYELQKIVGSCFVIIDDSQNQVYENYIKGLKKKS